MRRARRRRQVHLVYRGRANSECVQRGWAAWRYMPDATPGASQRLKILFRSERTTRRTAAQRHRADAKARLVFRRWVEPPGFAAACAAEAIQIRRDLGLDP